MSKLSLRCKQLIESEGQTVYSFSKSTGLDRTGVHRLVTGKRLPSRDFLLSFCNGLRINAHETKELLELYEEEKVGTTVYLNRKFILRSLSLIKSLENPILSETESSYNGVFPQYTESFFTTQAQIFHVLESAFCAKTDMPCILTNFPTASAVPLSGRLCELYLKYRRKVTLKHLITFSPAPSAEQDANCNLKILTQILPLALSDFDTYLPYCTYSHISGSNYSLVPWPYYIITENAVLEISYDMKKSILRRNPVEVNLCRREMERIFSEARPLIQIPHTLEDSVNLYSQVSWPSHLALAALESLPCFTWSVPRQLLYETAKKLLPESVSTGNRATFPYPPSMNSAMPSYFSLHCLTDFLRTGQITGQMTSYIPPLTPEDRRKTLLDFISSNGNSMVESHALKLHMDFPSNLYIELLPGQQILFCMFRQENTPRFALLHESSIYDAFADFFQYLADENNSYSVRETNEIIKKLMDECLPTMTF